jgi:hypothetical protein
MISGNRLGAYTLRVDALQAESVHDRRLLQAAQKATTAHRSRETGEQRDRRSAPTRGMRAVLAGLVNRLMLVSSPRPG